MFFFTKIPELTVSELQCGKILLWGPEPAVSHLSLTPYVLKGKLNPQPPAKK